MAGVELNYATAGTSLTSATAKTVLKIPSVSNRRQQVEELEFDMTGVDTTQNHVLVEVLRQVAAESGAGTSTSLSPTASEPDAPEAANAISTFPARMNYSAEPTWGTAPTVIRSFRIHPQGARVFPLTADQGKIEGTSDRAMYVRLTSPDGIAANVQVYARTKV